MVINLSSNTSYGDVKIIKKMMYRKRGFHLSIIPLPLTIKKCPRDHFCRRRFSPVSLLHAVGVASSQSFNRVLLSA